MPVIGQIPVKCRVRIDDEYTLIVFENNAISLVGDRRWNTMSPMTALRLRDALNEALTAEEESEGE